ncbi:D-N-carbamoylase [Pseudooceanicola sediminis]|uniref:D-N-carbamoylase n=2 Tax=Pseudooceanicola sediminis TaxID=2211117 RepID=A0A399J2Z5_9RHOB|nr:D-N-carbamoylase [Puniceibacterium sp. HSS470]RII39803.1 D-N-carbamoylase [Pseudooceanicola sediminis]
MPSERRVDRFVAAALQLGPASATIAETVDRIIDLLARAAAQKARIAVLPELALTPYFAAEIRPSVEPFASVSQNAEAISRIGKAAQEHAIAVVLPHAEAAEAGLYNAMAFIDAAGEVRGRFRKVHIPGQTTPDPAKDITILEKRYFLDGDLGFPVYDLGPARVGGMICYDRRFPESYRALMQADAELFAVSYNTPVMNGGTLEKARAASRLAICGGAFANATYAIAAGKAGVENGVTYIGDSFICSPEGEVMATAQSMDDEVVVAELSMPEQQALRARWNFAANLRPDVYRARHSDAA